MVEWNGLWFYLLYNYETTLNIVLSGSCWGNWQLFGGFWIPNLYGKCKSDIKWQHLRWIGLNFDHHYQIVRSSSNHRRFDALHQGVLHFLTILVCWVYSHSLLLKSAFVVENQVHETTRSLVDSTVFAASLHHFSLNQKKKIVQSPFCHRFTYFCCLNDYKIPTNNLPHPTLRWMLPGPWLCSALRGDAWRRKKKGANLVRHFDGWGMMVVKPSKNRDLNIYIWDICGNHTLKWEKNGIRYGEKPIKRKNDVWLMNHVVHSHGWSFTGIQACYQSHPFQALKHLWDHWCRCLLWTGDGVRYPLVMSKFFN